MAIQFFKLFMVKTLLTYSFFLYHFMCLFSTFLSVLSLPCCICFSLAVSRGCPLVAGHRLLSLGARLWGKWVSVRCPRAQGSQHWAPGHRRYCCGAWLSCSVASSRIRTQTHVSPIGSWVLHHWAPGKPEQRILDFFPRDTARCRSSPSSFLDS